MPEIGEESARFLRLLLRSLEGDPPGPHSAALRRLAWAKVNCAAVEILHEAARLGADLGMVFPAYTFTEKEFQSVSADKEVQ